MKEREAYLLVLDDIVSASVACGAVACEYLSTVLKVSGEGCGGDGHDANNDGSSDLCHRLIGVIQLLVTARMMSDSSHATTLIIDVMMI